MIVIVGVALLMTLVMSFRSTSDHPYYFINKAVVSRRLEFDARQRAASARASGREDEAANWENFAGDLSRDAVEYLKSSREGGYVTSELPEGIRRKLKPEDLNPQRLADK